MKIAVSGKGGVGKTTFSALLVRALNEQGKHVLAVDADPDANLAAATGIPDPDKIIPISEMRDLIYERTEAKPGTTGGFFKLNPKVDDIPDNFSAKFEQIKLMRLGTVKKGGGGCLCPASTLLRALITHLVLSRDDVVVMDMEAGIERLPWKSSPAFKPLRSRAEPGRRSIETANNIKKLAQGIGLKNIGIVGNKIRSKKDEDFLRNNLPDFSFLGFLPFDEALIEADLDGISPFDLELSLKTIIYGIISKLYGES